MRKNKDVDRLRKKSEKLKKKQEKEKISTYKNNERKYNEALKEKNYSKPVEKEQPKSKELVKLLWKSNIPDDYTESIGERKIKTFLLEHGIKYGKEVSFEFLPELRFDFYLPRLRVCIEFDGAQHFKYVEKFDNGDFTRLEKRKINDNRKTKFCKRYDIKLIRIPYYKENKIKEILNILL